MTEQVVVVYHYEHVGTWGATYWAESEQMPGFSAANDDLFDLMGMVRAAVLEMHGPDVDHRSCWADTGQGVLAFKSNDNNRGGTVVRK